MHHFTLGKLASKQSRLTTTDSNTPLRIGNRKCKKPTKKKKIDFRLIFTAINKRVKGRQVENIKTFDNNCLQAATS